MHESHVMRMPGQAHGQSSCNSLGRPQHFDCCFTTCLTITSVTLAACGSHLLYHSFTARGMGTGIPRIRHRNHDKLNTPGREVTLQESQQSQDSHVMHNSFATEHSSHYPVLLRNLFVLQMIFSITTETVVNIKVSPAVRTYLHNS